MIAIWCGMKLSMVSWKISGESKVTNFYLWWHFLLQDASCKHLEARYPDVQQVRTKVILETFTLRTLLCFHSIYIWSEKIFLLENINGNNICDVAARARRLMELIRPMWWSLVGGCAPIFLQVSSSLSDMIHNGHNGNVDILLRDFQIFMSNWHHLVPIWRPGLFAEVWKLDLQRIQCKFTQQICMLLKLETNPWSTNPPIMKSIKNIDNLLNQHFEVFPNNKCSF